MTAPRPLVSRPPREWADLHPGASPLDLDADPPRGPRPPDDTVRRPDYVELQHSHALVERSDAEAAGLAYREHRQPVGFLNNADGTPKEPRSW